MHTHAEKKTELAPTTTASFARRKLPNAMRAEKKPEDVATTTATIARSKLPNAMRAGFSHPGTGAK